MKLGRRTRSALLVGLPLFIANRCLADAVVHVEVENVRDDRGQVRVALCARSEFLSKHCRLEAVAKASSGTVQVTFNAVAEGKYAVQAWHDENGTGKLDQDILGIPREGVGFSNDPPLLFGPPSFGSAAFAVEQKEVCASLRLHYYK